MQGAFTAYHFFYNKNISNFAKDIHEKNETKGSLMRNLKHILLLTVMVCYSPLLQAQTVVDTITMRFAYDSRVRMFKDKRRLTDEHWLEIGKNGTSKYYSRWRAIDQHLKDSIASVGADADEYMRLMKERVPRPSRFDHIIFKNLPKRGELTGTSNPYYDGFFIYTEDTKIDWQLVNDTAKHEMLGHECFKAEANFHGRKWIAFYAPDIPIADGPWKLSGLPGLILYACDENKDYIFSCMGIYTDLNEPMTQDKRKYITVTPQKLEKILFDYYSDPLGSLEARRGNGGDYQIRDSKGRSMSKPMFVPVLIDYYGDTTDKNGSTDQTGTTGQTGSQHLKP